VIERLMLIQSIETVRCLEEGVLTSPQDADVGAILGWGYPPFRGGPIARSDPGRGQLRRRLRPPGGTMRRALPARRKPAQIRRGF
jgi:hypothetical protein